MRTLPLLLLAGCAFDRTGLTSDDVVPDAEVVAIDADPGAPDADPDAPDADPDAPDAMPAGCQSWTAANVADPCDEQFGEPGTITLISGRNRYDTDSGVLTAPGGATSTPPSVILAQDDGPDARVLVLSALAIPAGTALVAEGGMPLIAIVYGDATIAGTIDVSAITNAGGTTSTPGAGGDDTILCGMGIPDVGADSTGLGGAGAGAGGGYGSDGGDGGDGNGGGHGNGAGKGKANGNATIVPLRGGCRGSTGGNTSSIADDGGRPGSGGGGFELTAFGAISITGTIAANGTGGGGVALVAGGGGGAGSGGAILLDGDTVTIGATAKLCANGGGGGEGGATGLTATEDGENATCVETPRANGGDGTADAGNGGDGGALATPTGTNGSNGANSAGGGAGGGGVGRTRVHGRSTLTLDVGSVVSPDSTP